MLRTLSTYIGRYKAPTIASPVFATVEVLLEVIIPFFMAGIIDIGIPSHDTAYITRMALFLAGCALVSLICGVLSGVYAARASAGFAANVRHAVFEKVQDFSFENIDRFSSAGLVTRLTTDITNIQNAYAMIIRIAVRAPVMMLASFGLALAVNARLSLVFLAAIVVLGGGLAFLILTAHPIFDYVFKRYDVLNRVVQENIRGIRVVKSYVREQEEIRKFDEISGEIHAKFVTAEKLFALNSPLMQFTIFACMLTVSTLSARMIVQGTMSTGELTSLITYIIQILMSVMMLSITLLMITIARTSAERVALVLNEQSTLENPPQPLMRVADGSIRFRDVSFRYHTDDDLNALCSVNLDIASGQTIGIVGDTGSSKSTLVQLIARLYDVTSGSVEVAGHDVRDYDLTTLRNRVAMVLQNNVLFSGTIKDNLRWGNPTATDSDLVRACRMAQADEFIRELPDGYNTRIEQGGSNVSGGQKQRLCIARALLKNPQIIILDDSTSAVDTGTEALLRRAFAEELPEVTKLIIAQRISSVCDSDSIIVMDNGRVSACGTHDELLLTSDMYRQIYASQQRGGVLDDE
ncbi:MAG: ABC transporter ATP-binding protein/permease [Actinomycetes bacterium]|jgi:ATP-binding cassette subfamily B protein|nr:ABC transporter ATP-binding protein/permease [Actinomycetes bacterium]